MAADPARRRAAAGGLARGVPLNSTPRLAVRPHAEERPDARAPRVPALAPAPAAPPPASAARRSLLDELGERLAAERIAYVQWKGHRQRTRWMSGEGDVDLLVDRGAEPRFGSVLSGLGFRRAELPPASAIAGIESHFGLDSATGQLIHVHAHYRLMLGGSGRTVYRLPIEPALLASALPGPVFPVPRPEFELIAFAVRMVLRHTALDALRRSEPRWLSAIQGELDWLLANASRTTLAEIVARDLPSLDPAFLDRCLASLRPGHSRGRRLALRRELERRLRPHAGPRPLALTGRRLGRRAFGRGGPLRGPGSGKQFAHGGTVAALVGGDGAGKSTCTRELAAWLAAEFRVVTAHLGRPPRSLSTLAVGLVFKLARAFTLCATTDEERARAPGYLAALRDICTARDRYRLQVKARRVALTGGIALCERYPVPQNQLLCGPRLQLFAESLGRTRLGRLLVAAEAWYYRQILPPDVLIVLRVDPETAVRRKTDEPATYVRARCQLVWDTDWTGTGAHIVDAGRPLPAVLADLKTVLWQEL